MVPQPGNDISPYNRSEARKRDTHDSDACTNSIVYFNILRYCYIRVQLPYSRMYTHIILRRYERFESTLGNWVFITFATFNGLKLFYFMHLNCK